jgi:hypothetical protein
MFIILHSQLTFWFGLNFHSPSTDHLQEKELKVFNTLLHISCTAETGIVHYVTSCDLAVDLTDLLGLFL